MLPTLAERIEVLAPAISARAVAAGRYAHVFTDAMWQGEGPARVREWGAAGCPTGPFEVVYVGSDRVGRVVDDVMARIPAPVAFHVSRSVIVAGQDFVGGYFLRLPRLPDGHTTKHLLVIADSRESDDGTAGIVAHEIAHSWTTGLDEGYSSAELQKYHDAKARVLRVANRDTREYLLRGAKLSERIAATLAKEWGFSGPGTDIEHAIDGAERAWRNV